jgi:hypothetical protein
MSTRAASSKATLESHLQAQGPQAMRLFWHRLRWHAVSTMLPRGGPFDLVDVGAGAGFAGEFLQRDFPAARYFFVEPLRSLEERLEHRFGVERNLGGAAAFRGVRAVLLLDVLEHQERDRAFLRELVDKMDPGAMLIATVPALRMLWSEWDVVLGHFRRYDKALLRAAVADAPVRVREISYLFPELVPVGIVRRLLPGGGAGKGSGEFPELAGPVNEALYWMGRCTLPLRRLAPFGSSLCLRLEKR